MSGAFFSKFLGSLREIGLELAKLLCSIGKIVAPGQKLCPKCRIHGNSLESPPECLSLQEGIVEENDDGAILEQDVSLCMSRDSLNSTLSNIELSPIKVHSMQISTKLTYGKRKLDQIQEVVQQKMASVLNIDQNQLECSSSHSNLKELQTKADDLDYLVTCMKEKLKVANRKEKLQVLTLTPRSWKLRRAAQEFEVSKSTIQKARSLQKRKGIIGIEDLKSRQRCSQQTITLVTNFYCSDENSRQLPGKKDSVSVAKNERVSKRLLLCNLKELYALFKGTYAEEKLSFSKFASLRPKWCVSAGPKGTHSVCICSYHQNVKLLLSAIGLEDSYQTLIEMIVCNYESKVCMVHRCQDCPGILRVSHFLETYLRGKDDEYIDSEVSFKQWVTTDRSNLTMQTLPVEEFLSLVCEKLDAITKHSYIARNQSKYLKNLKENLSINEVIVLGDFAENYQFLIQDEIQGYHWNSQQCTIHPVVIYFHPQKSSEKLSHLSLCFISDDLSHDVSFVHQIMSNTLKFIKCNISCKISKVHYFSDGCAGQYKNKKHFLNLCHHKEDFSMECEWNFFATSHGKSPCDGIGGTVKRLTAKASLQRPIKNQITTAAQMVEFCSENVKGINFLHISKEQMKGIRNYMDKRFVYARTVPGTRGFHQYVPISQNIIGCKRMSGDIEFDLVHEFLPHPSKPQLETIDIGSYVVCSYDSLQWVGIVSEIDKESDDRQVKFMHPHYPATSYNWPSPDDLCWIPRVSVLAIVEPPVPMSVGAHHYKLSTDTISKIDEVLCMMQIKSNSP